MRYVEKSLQLVNNLVIFWSYSTKGDIFRSEIRHGISSDIWGETQCCMQRFYKPYQLSFSAVLTTLTAIILIFFLCMLIWWDFYLSHISLLFHYFTVNVFYAFEKWMWFEPILSASVDVNINWTLKVSVFILFFKFFSLKFLLLYQLCTH